MSKLGRRKLRMNLKRSILWRVAIIRHCVCSFCTQMFCCYTGKSSIRRYRQLLNSGPLPSPPSKTVVATVRHQFPSTTSGEMEVDDGFTSGEITTTSPATACDHHNNKDASDLVALKISLLGDNHIGKTSFLAKYVGKEREQKDVQNTGVIQMDKTLCVKGARISYSIWEVGGDAYSLGDRNSRTSIPAACKDSVAMLFMFDLTSRCTLNSVINWYQQARKYNQTAIPVMVGSKFDDFVQLPIDLQWTIASQARAYARAINATLFFSSASYNINVNKIFKFITAKLFNLPWTLERNLKIGEPIIDF